VWHLIRSVCAENTLCCALVWLVSLLVQFVNMLPSTSWSFGYAAFAWFIIVLSMFVGILWYSLISAAKAAVQQTLANRKRACYLDGTYNMPHTQVEWPQRQQTNVQALRAAEDDVDDISQSQYSQCQFLPEHAAYFDVSTGMMATTEPLNTDGTPPHSPRLMYYRVAPWARAGNGLSPPTRLRATVIWIPDLTGLDSARHAAHLAHACAQVGVGWVSMDCIGFGENVQQGTPGHIEDFKHAVEQQFCFASCIRRNQPREIPVFLAGNGFGASLAIAVAIRMQQQAKGKEDERRRRFGAAGMTSTNPLRAIEGLILLSPAVHLYSAKKEQRIAKLLVRYQQTIIHCRPASRAIALLMWICVAAFVR
jgi:hypothetical protein